MIYLFGDSFSSEKEKFFYPTLDYTPWFDLVSQELNQEKINYSLPGCSNEYIFYNFYHSFDNFQEDDKIIICPTSKNRIWLLEDFPELSNFNGLKSLDIISKDQKNAITAYQKYLQSDKYYDIKYAMFILAIRELCRNTLAHVLILPTFHSVIGVTGDLTTVSEQEFETEELLDLYYQNYDYRVNHLSQENHDILAKKVLDFFVDNKEVDLTKDFKKSIITQENISKYQILS